MRRFRLFFIYKWVIHFVYPTEARHERLVLSQFSISWVVKYKHHIYEEFLEREIYNLDIGINWKFYKWKICHR